MILLSLDFETTGVDRQNDEVIELGAVLYSTGQHKCLDNLGVLVKTDRVITPKITKITGITKAALDKFGYESRTALDLTLEMVLAADYIIGYNVRRFDREILWSWVKRENRLLPEKLWVDLYADLPWQVPMGKLSHVAADHGILNLFPHSALADCQTVLALGGKYDWDMLVKRAQSPIVILRSRQGRNENDLVKEAPFKFRWNPDKKIWWKPVKQQDVDEVINAAGFEISIEKELSIEELEN
jgi:DNA polymerase III epsilon subunit-like protein